jgi:hypothetical protein
VYGTTSLEISRLHREDLLREARAERLTRTARAGRSSSEGSAFLRWAAASSWELARAAGLFRKRFRERFRTPKGAD